MQKRRRPVRDHPRQGARAPSCLDLPEYTLGLLEDAIQGDELHAARLSMAERRLREVFTALGEAERWLEAANDRATVASPYHQAVSAYEEISPQHPTQA
jgi:hypothetical protein